nr:MAG TPA: hypothetical protein [Caudoviricetes sp.]
MPATTILAPKFNAAFQICFYLLLSASLRA